MRASLPERIRAPLERNTAARASGECVKGEREPQLPPRASIFSPKNPTYQLWSFLSLQAGCDRGILTKSFDALAQNKLKACLLRAARKEQEGGTRLEILHPKSDV